MMPCAAARWSNPRFLIKQPGNICATSELTDKNDATIFVIVENIPKFDILLINLLLINHIDKNQEEK